MSDHHSQIQQRESCEQQLFVSCPHHPHKLRGYPFTEAQSLQRLMQVNAGQSDHCQHLLALSAVT